MPGTSLALLSWSEQVSQPHTRCSKGSPLGEAPISCYSYPHLPHRTLPARNSPSSLLHSHTTSFGNRFNTNPCLGNARPEVVSPTKTASNQQTRILGLCSHSPVSGEPTFLHPRLPEMLSHRAAPFHGQSSEVGSLACNDWTGSNPDPQAKGCLNLGFGTIKDEARETWTCTVTLYIKLHFLTWIQIQL